MKRWRKKLWAGALILRMILWPLPIHGQEGEQTAEPGEPEETVFTLLESESEDRPITRAEAAAVVVRAFGAMEEAEVQEYVDVPQDSWYRKDMARAVAMGAMQGYEGYLRPQGMLTWEEAGLIFQRLFCLDRNPAEGKESQEPITRGEFVQMGAQLVPQRLTAGSQGWQMDGNTLISQSGNYSQLVVMGDLILTEGASGQVCLQDVVIYGQLVVRGSGQVTMKGVSWADQVLLTETARSIHLEAEKGCATKVKVGAPMAVLSGFFTQVELESDGVQLILDGAWVSNLQMQGKNNGVMASPGNFIRCVECWGDQGTIAGTGQVEQVRAYGKGLYVGTPGTQVIVLSETGNVWAGESLLEQGSLVTSGKGEGFSPEEEKPDNTQGAGNGGSSSGPSGGSSGGSEDGDEGEVIPPEEPEKWPQDQISLESGHTSQPVSGVTFQETEGVYTLQLERGTEEELLWGYPSQETREAFEGRDPQVPFGMVALHFMPGGELEEGGSTTVSWSSKTLLAMGYTPEDSQGNVTYEKGNQGMIRRWEVENSQLEQGLTVFVPISSLEEQIPITICWNNEEEVAYQLCVGTPEFQWMTPPDLTVQGTVRGPEITLSYQRGGTVETSLLRLVSAQDPQKEYGRWESSHLEKGEVCFQWTLTGENCPPLNEKLLLILEETCGEEREQWEKELLFTGDELGALLPGEEGMMLFAAKSDNLTKEQTQVLEGMWNKEGETPFAGLLSFQGQTLRVDCGRSQGLGDWCQENLGRRELPVAIYSTVPLPGVDMSFEWITSVIWLDADLLETEGLQCIAAEEGPALFILRYGDTIVEETD